MSVALVQFLLCLAAGYLLWWVWRSFAAEDGLTRAIVFIGFLGRAIAGVALFWISYLRLPFLRSLQLGDGLWFFATDATLYVPTAAAAARDGLFGIITFTRSAASVTYVQALALFGLLFGMVTSVGLLLNLFSYLGSCAAIVRLRRSTPAGRVPGTVALAAISLSPSAILWSLQPLKDTLFQFLIIGFVAACAMWQRGWRKRPSPALLTGAALLLFATMFASSGIRWYFAFAALAASLAFFVLVGVTVPRKTWALAMGLAMFVALTQAFIYGAGAYTPPRIKAMLSPMTSLETRIAAMSPGAFAGDIDEARDNFDRAGGDTSIGVGSALTGMERESGSSASPPVVIAAAPTAGDAPPGNPREQPSAREESTDEARRPRSMTSAARESASHPPPADVAEASQATPDGVVPATPAPTETAEASAAPSEHRPVTPSDSHPPSAGSPAPAEPHGSSQARVSSDPLIERRAETAAPPLVAPAHPRSAPPASVRPQSAPPAAAEATGTEPPAAAPQSSASTQPGASSDESGSVAATTTANRGTAQSALPSGRRRRSEAGPTTRTSSNPGPAVVRETLTVAKAEPAQQNAPVVPRQGVEPPVVSSPGSTSQPTSKPAVPPAIVLPQSTVGKVVTGMIAVFVPRSLADRFDLIEVGGGRGLLWFTDLDTLMFDLIVLFGVVYIARRIRWATFRNPTFWLVVLIGFLVGIPLAYTITNFGTLFRLRMMLYTTAALAPLVLALISTHPDRSAPQIPVETTAARRNDEGGAALTS